MDGTGILNLLLVISFFIMQIGYSETLQVNIVIQNDASHLEEKGNLYTFSDKKNII